MVDTVEVSRLSFRDGLVVDLSVWMNDPDDWDFAPALSMDGNALVISHAGTGDIMSSIELDEEQMETVEADRTVTVRVKFQVHGMHGRLNDIHPIIADGKAKKLATANWKTVLPVAFE